MAGSARPGVLRSAASWSRPPGQPAAPGPLRAFYQRIQARRGFQKAIVVTARKMTILAWHLATRDEDYAFARPGLVTHKPRKLELAAGAPSPPVPTTSVTVEPSTGRGMARSMRASSIPPIFAVVSLWRAGRSGRRRAVPPRGCCP
jgi:hypothetical protein